jgi:hypothetical protein
MKDCLTRMIYNTVCCEKKIRKFTYSMPLFEGKYSVEFEMDDICLYKKNLIK